MGGKRNRRALAAALVGGDPVLLRRRLWKADHLEGFVVAVDRSWVVLNLVYDVGLNGWSIVRQDTIREVERQGPDTFIARALDWYGETPSPVDVDLDSVSDIVQSAAAHFPVVTIYTEAVDPTLCSIGRPQRITAKHVDVLDLTTDATWSRKPRRIALADITRVDLGARYETVLHHLAGYPPIPH